MLKSQQKLLGCILGCIAVGIIPFLASANDTEPSISKDSERPNIIHIMLDDLDIADVGVYGSPDVHTPTIDDLEQQGMRFDHYYSAAPVCSPARVSLLTGHYPAHFGIKRAITEDSMRGIPGPVQTLPETLQSTGYRTAHFGKWHVGTNKKEFLPTAAGFDHSVRLDTSNGLSYTNYVLNVDDNETVMAEPGVFLTEALTDRALKFLNEMRSEKPHQPFLVNLWYLAPHTPTNQVPENFDNEATRYCIAKDITEVKCDARRGNLAALVTIADQQIKRVLDFVDASPDLKKNTLIFVTSDNGGMRNSHKHLKKNERNLRGFKSEVFEGGIRVPLLARWPGKIQPGTINSNVVTSLDLYPTLVDITGSKPPEKPLPGESFSSDLLGSLVQRAAKAMFWENKIRNISLENNSGVYNRYAVRFLDWKLVGTPSERLGKPDKIELFDLKAPEAEAEPVTEPTSKPLIDTTVFGYSITLKPEEEHGANGTGKYQILKNSLQQLYFDWRRETGTIEYQPTVSNSGVTLQNNQFDFSGGFAEISNDTRLDFNDGDFGFITRIAHRGTEKRAMIAEKRGSWSLFLENQKINLEVIGGNTEPGQNSESTRNQVKLSASLEAGNSIHVAFSIFGWRDEQSTISLYVNGELADQRRHGNSVHSVSSTLDATHKFRLGNNSDGDNPFTGSIDLPRITALSPYPSEILWDYLSTP